jgi:hypothetical protein
MIDIKLLRKKRRPLNNQHKGAHLILFFKGQNQQLIHILKKMVDFDGGCCK